ncbi:unnamed protein product, partial [marine sediment metagenome]
DTSTASKGKTVHRPFIIRQSPFVRFFRPTLSPAK